MKTALLTWQEFHGRKKGAIGSSVLRGDWLMDNWPELKTWRHGEQYDAIIFQKVYWPYFWEDYKGVKILDLCDPDFLKGDFHLAEYSSLVDAITCSTETLTKSVKRFAKCPVYTIPDRINMDFFASMGEKEHKDRAKDVVWFGYWHNAKEVLPHIIQLLAKRDLNLTVVSNNPFEPINDWGCRIRNVEWDSETAYYEIQAGGDICINPASNNAGFKFKSNNKTLSAWSLGLPVATTIDELEKFIDPVERRKEVAKRKKELVDKWDIKISAQEYRDIIDEAWKVKKSTT